MELRHFRYFAAVAETLSFTRAAASLRLAQPSLSKQIRNFEDEIGVRLFDRDRNHVALTPAGTVMLDEARRLLSAAELAVRHARAAAEGRTGELRIAAVSPLTLAFLPASLAHFRQKFPDVQVSLQEKLYGGIPGALRSGDLDLGIVAAWDGRKHPGITSKCLLQCPVVVMMNPSHPLARKRTLSLHDLKDEVFLSVRFSGSGRHRAWIEAIARAAKFKPRFGEETDSPDGLPGMVAAGRGISLVAKIYERPSSPGYTFRTLSDPDLKFELHALWMRSNRSVPLANFMKIAVRDAAALQMQTVKRGKWPTKSA